MGDIPLPPIDVKSLYELFEDRIRHVFGKDAETQEWLLRIRSSSKIAMELAKETRFVGVAAPIPTESIYQPLKLVDVFGKTTNLDALLANVLGYNRSAIIFGGPGYGKTTLLRWLFLKLQRDPMFTAIMFPLRRAGIIDDLVAFIDGLVRGRKAGKRGRLLLLLDGYDEIVQSDRQRISDNLMLFSSYKLGAFFLTCRSSYNVLETPGDRYSLAPFLADDSLGFARAFLRAYGSRFSAEDLIDELRSHRLDEFAAHPLMLSLACIVRATGDQAIPRTAIGLIDLGIKTLTHRWDDFKGINREADHTTPFPSARRIELLSKVAFDLPGPEARIMDFERSAVRYLHENGCSDWNPSVLLEEISRWYGIITPASEGYLTFVHRTMHDYLAAKWWVYEHGFSPSTVRTWDYRAAYSACLVDDATDCVSRMLAEASTPMAIVGEVLYNRANIDVSAVANALCRRISKSRRIKNEDDTLKLGSSFQYELVALRPSKYDPYLIAEYRDRPGILNDEEARTAIEKDIAAGKVPNKPGHVSVYWSENYLPMASDTLLQALVACDSRDSERSAANCIAFLAAYELRTRGNRARWTDLPDSLQSELQRERIMSARIRIEGSRGAALTFDDLFEH